ncbi:IS1096 element passenger TnpR family protein [Paraburkholderia tropica]|uniref:IS1096 element passenger TnpR family protein n=1 Tax=Paraburkholderia tropica TaxID=92647 RepID=UPI003D2C41EA
MKCPCGIEDGMPAFALHEHVRFAYLYDFNSWWLHDVRVERRQCNHRSRPLPCCVAGSRAC